MVKPKVKTCKGCKHYDIKSMPGTGICLRFSEVRTFPLLLDCREGKSKYNNNRHKDENGVAWDGDNEEARHKELLQLEKAGFISDVVIKPIFELTPKFTDRQGRKHRAVTYEADFGYTELGEHIVEDVKGELTDLAQAKLKAFVYQYPEIVFVMIPVGNNKRLKEWTVWPKDSRLKQ
jgi:hypothetical protein